MTCSSSSIRFSNSDTVNTGPFLCLGIETIVLFSNNSVKMLTILVSSLCLSLMIKTKLLSFGYRFIICSITFLPSISIRYLGTGYPTLVNLLLMPDIGIIIFI